MVARKEGLQAQIPVPRVAELDLKRIGTVRVVFLRFKNYKQLAIAFIPGSVRVRLLKVFSRKVLLLKVFLPVFGLKTRHLSV